MAPTTASSCNRLRIGINQFRLNLLFLYLLFTPVCSRLVNVTVDDTFGDPTSESTLQYSAGKDDTWGAGSPTENCGDCHISPKNLDLGQIHKQTWHEVTVLSGETPIAITVQFTGSAAYVFNILPNTISGAVTTADISFSIDGENVGRFTRSPDSSSTILYNQLVYSNTTLSDGRVHTLVMTPNSNSIILFDYLIYSAEDDTATSPSSSTTGQHSPSTSQPETSINLPVSPTSIPPSTGGGHNNSPRRPSSSIVPLGAIVGAVLGVVLLLGAGVGLFLLLRRYKRRRAGTPMNLLSPADVLAHEIDSDLGESEDGASCVARPMSVSRTRAVSALLRFLDDTTTHNQARTLTRTSDLQLRRPDSALHTSIRATIVSESPLSAAAEPDPRQLEFPSKRREELSRRLEVLQSTRTALSSQTPSDSESRRSHSEVSSSEGGTATAMRALEAEIAMLRGVLVSMNVRILDGHGGYVAGSDEPLPLYSE